MDNEGSVLQPTRRGFLKLSIPSAMGSVIPDWVGKVFEAGGEFIDQIAFQNLRAKWSNFVIFNEYFSQDMTFVSGMLDMEQNVVPRSWLSVHLDNILTKLFDTTHFLEETISYRFRYLENGSSPTMQDIIDSAIKDDRLAFNFFSNKSLTIEIAGNCVCLPIEGVKDNINLVYKHYADISNAALSLTRAIIHEFAHSSVEDLNVNSVYIPQDAIWGTWLLEGLSYMEERNKENSYSFFYPAVTNIISNLLFIRSDIDDETGDLKDQSIYSDMIFDNHYFNEIELEDGEVIGFNYEYGKGDVMEFIAEFSAGLILSGKKNCMKIIKPDLSKRLKTVYNWIETGKCQKTEFRRFYDDGRSTMNSAYNPMLNKMLEDFANFSDEDEFAKYYEEMICDIIPEVILSLVWHMTPEQQKEIKPFDYALFGDINLSTMSYDSNTDSIKSKVSLEGIQNLNASVKTFLGGK